MSSNTIAESNFEIVRNSPLAAELRDEQCALLAAIIQQRRLCADEILLREGACDDSLHVLVAGKLTVIKKNDVAAQTLSVLGEGSIVGAMGFIDGTPHSATVIAACDTHIFTMRRESFDGVRKAHPETAYQVLKVVVKVAHDIIKRMNLQYVHLTQYASKNNARG